MSHVVWVLSLAAGISGTLCIAGKYRRSQMQVFTFKPMTTLLLLAVAVASGATQTGYGILVSAAIVFSVVGDIFLMLPEDRFVKGLVSFLFAHLALVLAFSQPWPGLTAWAFLGFSLPAFGMYRLLAPHLGRMKVPVTIYITVIVAMAWFGWERWMASGSMSGLMAAVGSILFLISDSTLALNRFRAEFPSADLIVLSTYYVSLWFLALSVYPAWM